METSKINLFIFDEKENFERTKEFIGDESFFKKIVCITDFTKFEEEMNKLKNDEYVFLIVHVFYTQEIRGVKKYIASKIKKDYPLVGEMYVSEGSNEMIQEKMLHAKIEISEIRKYHEIQSYLEEDKVTVYTKREIMEKSEYRYASINDKKNDSEHDFEFAIITALFEDELESVIDVFNLQKDKKLKLGDKNLYTGCLDVDPNKKILSTYQTETGRTDASGLVTEIIKEFSPKYIFMTGVCGGNEKTSFGDIIVAKFVFTFDKGKISDDDFLREIELVKIDERCLREIRENKNKVLEKVVINLKSNKKYIEEFSGFSFDSLNSIIDPMACSSAVVNKANYFNEVIRKIERKATAVEMESYGFARAAESTNSGKTKSIIIKSVMDNTVDKSDIAKKYASYTSAIFLKSLLEMEIF